MTLERYASPAVTAEVVAAIAERHGLNLEPSNFTRLTDVGINNAIYALGESLILRVARNDEGIFESARKEAVAALAGRAAGVRTPELIAFDSALDLLPTPYSVYERVRGETLGLLGLEPADTPEVWRELGRDLARLHTGVSETGPAGRLEREAASFPSPYELAQEGYFTASEARWLGRWLERLEAASGPAPRRFLHHDLQTTNLMVRAGSLEPGSLEYVALLDWGSCGWGDPAHDLASAPLRAVPFLLTGYREVAPVPGDGAEARVLRRTVEVALYLARRRPVPTWSWAERPLGQLLEVFRFLLESPRSPWAGLAP